jgi:hypothetical protein
VIEKEINRIEASIEMPRRGISIFRPPQMSIHYLFARESLTQPGRGELDGVLGARIK